MTQTLTPRQQQIFDMLAEDPRPSVKAIADRLGISRNAVYQQIQRLRRTGVLDEEFTVSGQPAREERKLTVSLPAAGVRVGAGDISQLIQRITENGDDANDIPLVLVQELNATALKLQQLSALAMQYIVRQK